jgi:hypothetical protein
LVIAQESLEDGWYEAIVVERNGDMLNLRWRDPKNEVLAAIAANQPAGKSLAGKRTASASSKVDQPFPLTWDEIALDLLVLAKQDGPWGSWFEASRSKATATALRCVGGITNE